MRRYLPRIANMRIERAFVGNTDVLRIERTDTPGETACRERRPVPLLYCLHQFQIAEQNLVVERPIMRSPMTAKLGRCIDSANLDEPRTAVPLVDVSASLD